jgi:hypothetical protein
LPFIIPVPASGNKKPTAHFVVEASLLTGVGRKRQLAALLGRLLEVWVIVPPKLRPVSDLTLDLGYVVALSLRATAFNLESN